MSRPRLFLAALALAAAPAARTAGQMEAGPARLVRGPYVEAVTRTSAAVCWRLDFAAPSALEYWPAADAARRAAGTRDHRSAAPAGGKTRVGGERAAVDRCEALSGLEPSTEYAYRVLGAQPELTHRFRSAEGPWETRLKFAVTGDTGERGSAVTEVGAALAREDAAFVLHVGDVVYPSGKDEHYDERYFAPYAGFLDRAPVYIAIGNHDYGNKRDADSALRRLREHFLAIHRLPEPAFPRLSREDPPTYYSFDRGTAHFSALDANSTYDIPGPPPIGAGSAQARWLEADLAASTAPWKFVFVHQPLYSTGKHGRTEPLRRALAGLLEAAGVDIVFQGHDHNYERTKPIKAGKAAEDGVVYITAGNGGAKLRRQRKKVPAWSAVFDSRHGFVRVALDGPRLVVEAVGTDGAVFDRWEKVKPGPRKP